MLPACIIHTCLDNWGSYYYSVKILLLRFKMSHHLVLIFLELCPCIYRHLPCDKNLRTYRQCGMPGWDMQWLCWKQKYNRVKPIKTLIKFKGLNLCNFILCPETLECFYQSYLWALSLLLLFDSTTMKTVIFWLGTDQCALTMPPEREM